MTSFTDQLSAVRKTQWEAQLDVFRTLTSRALDSAGQLMALNMKASRLSVEQTAGAVRSLLDAREPRDLAAVGSVAQSQWNNLFSYGRELIGIAAGAHMLPAPTATLPTSAGQAMEQAAIAIAEATTVRSEIAAAAADTGAALAASALASAAPATPASAPAPAARTQAQAEAAIDAAIADETPAASAKPVASALNELAPKPAGAEHPLASTVVLEALEAAAPGNVELPAVAPVESTPPPVASSGPAQKPPRHSRKK